MRQLIVSMMVSADGLIEGPDGDLGWHRWNEEMTNYMMEVFESSDAFVYGRKSYELMTSYWPGRDDPFARVMNERKKYVLSRSLEQATWNAEVLHRDAARHMRKLKKQPGKDLVLFAGAEATGYFRKHGLIDEYRLLVNPLILGSGKPLFGPDAPADDLTLLEARPFQCGNTLLHYTTQNNRTNE